MTAFTDSEYTYLHELDLNGIKERVEQASEGPWEVRNDNEGTEYFPFYVISKVDDEAGEWFAELHVGCEQDARFIAHARQDVPALIAEVERLRVDNFLLRRHITTDESRVENEKLRAENERLHELLCEIHIDCGEMLDVYVEESGVVAIREKILEVWRTR